jgi:biotin carboxyl carrier protein
MKRSDTGQPLHTLRIYEEEYNTEFTEKFKRQMKWRPPNKKHVLAVIPGTILEILVKNGQKVKSGETLLILDAMKMENCIAMPFDGVIRKVRVEKGQIVSKNQLLVEIDS